MTALVMYGSGNYTMWLLASIVSYPCVELVRVFAHRAAKKISPMQAGNDHTHNFLYRVCRQAGLGRIAANSLTGCAIAIVSAGPCGAGDDRCVGTYRYCGLAGVFCCLHRSSHGGCSLAKDDSRAVCQLRRNRIFAPVRLQDSKNTHLSAQSQG